MEMAKEYSVMAPKELSPLINDLKMSSPGDNRDAGFCSGEDEDLDVDHADTDADNSPTDVSEDSVDVKVHVIGGITQKRKHVDGPETNPKRTKEDSKSRSPFRPWSHESSSRPNVPHLPVLPVPCGYVPPNHRPAKEESVPQPIPSGYVPPNYRPTEEDPSSHRPTTPNIPSGYVPPNHRPTEQDEPLSLVVKAKDRIYKPKYAGRLRASEELDLKREPISPEPQLEPCPPLLRPPEFATSPEESIRLSRGAYFVQSPDCVGREAVISGQDRISNRSPGVSKDSVQSSIGLQSFSRFVPTELSPSSTDVKLLNRVVPESVPSEGLRVNRPCFDVPAESIPKEARMFSCSPGVIHREPVPSCSNVRPSSPGTSSASLYYSSRNRDLSPNQGPPKLRIKMEHRDPDELKDRVPDELTMRIPNDLNTRIAISEHLHRRTVVPEELSRQMPVPDDMNPAYREMTVKEEPEDDPRDGRKKSSQQQRNYKNMTRERRMEANARERTRVHTISAAFETLRHAVPAYSHNQKLSKLSVLRIACSYIMTLSRIAGLDYSADQSEPSIASCVENVSRTIQMEGKLRKKKDEH